MLRAVTSLATAATRGMARAFDVNRVGLLRLVAERGAVTPGEAAAVLDLPASSVTRHAQALADAGQVRMERNPADARSCLLRPTESGRAELAALDDAGFAVFDGVVAGWSDADIRAMTRLADRLNADWAAQGAGQQRRVRDTSRRRPRWQYPEE
jgi:DNA-binding MarR family transcriptional regulator